ncbi:MAG: hypothetical protein EBZ49_14430 [Proteobacteria bacterium]|nr:hypothetical protein [Pseudomonadota bacterium]
MIDVIWHTTPKPKPPYLRLLFMLAVIVAAAFLHGCTKPAPWDGMAFPTAPYSKMGMIGSGL